MFKAYADESGRGDRQIYVDAGFSATADQWMKFSEEWEAVLKRPPAISVFRAADALSMRGEFNRRRFSEEGRNERVGLLIEIINKHATCCAAFAVETEDYLEAFGNKKIAKTMDEPCFHAHTCFIINMLVKHYELGLQGKVDFIFDSINDRELTEIWSVWDRSKRLAPPWILRRMGRRPIYEDDEQVLPLQAADLVASALARCYKDRAAGLEAKDSVAASWMRSIQVPAAINSWTPDQSRQAGETLISQMQGRKEPYETGKARSGRLNRDFAKPLASEKKAK
jgi:hypothetical protein